MRKLFLMRISFVALSAKVVPILMLLALVLRFGPPAYAALSKVGPIDTANGFPVWYQDSNGLALELCPDPTFCNFEGVELPNPKAPLSFPDNYPDEMFWWTGDARMRSIGPTGQGSARLIMAVEASYFNDKVLPGDQISFSRIRLKIDGFVPGGQYTITHPYGVLNLAADAAGGIKYVNDFGIGAAGEPGGFAGLLGGVVGPFLVWDETQSVTDDDTGEIFTTPPPGFIGDVGIEHQVTGSPFDTNFFMIEGPGLGSNGVSTDLFTVTGKIFTGVHELTNLQVDRASYSWFDGYAPQAQVFVTAQDAVSQLVVSSVGGATSPLLAPILMEQIFIPGDPFAVPPIPDQPTNKYLANLDIDLPRGQLVPGISITDLSLNQALRATLTDRVAITEASFDLSTFTLTVRASSSDEVTPHVLVVVGADLTNKTIDLTTGTFTTVLAGPASSVTVQSSLGGVDTAEVVLTGLGSINDTPAFTPPVAYADLSQDVLFVDSRVQLSAAASTGVISDFSWVQIGVDADGNTVAISNPNSSNISFNFPNTVNAPIPLFFQVAVTGPGGVSSASVVVSPLVAPSVIPTITRAQVEGAAPGGAGGWRIEGTINPGVPGTTVDIIVFDPEKPGVTQTIATGVETEPVFGEFQFVFREKGITLTISATTLYAIAISDTGNESAPFPVVQKGSKDSLL